MSGKLIGIGVGPGAPDLLTLRAVRRLESARHLVYIAARPGTSMARRIAEAHIPASAHEHEVVMPMQARLAERAKLYDEAAETLRPLLAAGESVTVLCEGDPLFYGSFIYFLERLGGEFPVEVVPGVASPMAAASFAAKPLAIRDDSFLVLPATLPAEELKARIDSADNLAIMKLGRHLPKVRRLLEELRLDGQATYVAGVGLPEEMHCPLKDAPDAAPYFSLLIVTRRDAPWT